MPAAGLGNAAKTHLRFVGLPGQEVQDVDADGDMADVAGEVRGVLVGPRGGNGGHGYGHDGSLRRCDRRKGLCKRPDYLIFSPSANRQISVAKVQGRFTGSWRSSRWLPFLCLLPIGSSLA